MLSPPLVRRVFAKMKRRYPPSSFWFWNILSTTFLLIQSSIELRLNFLRQTSSYIRILPWKKKKISAGWNMKHDICETTCRSSWIFEIISDFDQYPYFYVYNYCQNVVGHFLSNLYSVWKVEIFRVTGKIVPFFSKWLFYFSVSSAWKKELSFWSQTK